MIALLVNSLFSKTNWVWEDIENRNKLENKTEKDLYKRNGQSQP